MTFIVKLILNFFDYFTEKKINKILLEHLNNKPVNIIDIGSHKGEYINKSLKKFNINKIHAFEANPKVFKLLSRKFSKNFKVILNNLGVGDKSEKINLFSNIETSSSTFNTLNEKSNYFKKKYLILNFFKKKISTPVLVSIIKLEDYIKAKKLIEIDLLKIDTEGYEYKVIKGIGNEIQNIKLIHLEHHFDDMIIKNYTLSDIHKYLTNKGFKKIFKIKMKFRKSFEYIYQNQLNK